jgi:hypothetical protein
MSRSSDARRPYVRTTPSLVGRAARAIADAAGSAGGIERARVEQLEPRKMLFSVSIDPGSVDPTTGLGIATGFFGYFIPYLIPTSDVGMDVAENVTEDFNDEDVGTVFSGDVFDGSDILFQATGGQLTQVNTPGGQNADDLQILDVNLFGVGASISFSTLADPMDIAGGRNVNSSVTFTAGLDGNPNFSTFPGLLNGQVEVELLFQGAVQDTYTQADLLAQAEAPGGLSNYILTVRPLTSVGVFDEVRFVQRAPGGGGMNIPADFVIDDLNFVQPPNNFGDIIDDRRAAVGYRFVGPAGATAEFLDLYGRQIIETIALGSGEDDTNFSEGDADSDGVPEFNDGIGRINLSGFNENSSFSLLGLTIETFQGMPPANSVATEDEYAAVLPSDVSSFDDFEDSGFGFFVVTNGTEQEVVGLPEGPGHVIIGAPFVRPQNAYNPGGQAPANIPQDFDFSIDDQGVFLTDGSSIGQVVTDAILFGSSTFSASVGQLSAGLFLGSLTVDGDLGALFSGSDAGVVQNEPEALMNVTSFRLVETDSQVSVGRTLGQVVVLGRSFLDITVDGNLSGSSGATQDDVLVYNEFEVITGVVPPVSPVEVTQNTLLLNGIGLGAVVTSSSLAFIPPTVVVGTPFGDTYFRNDTILNAEFVGSAASTVVVRGSIGGFDGINTGEDQGDVFAFAVDGSREIVIEDISGFAGFAAAGIRILDADGRTVAASTGDSQTGFGASVRFRPDAPGVYYLSVINARGGAADSGIDFQYNFLLSGLAPVTFGSYRAGLGNGGTNDLIPTDDAGVVQLATISVLSGSIGQINIGTGYVNAAGQEDSPVGLLNTFDGGDDLMFTARGLAVSTPGSLYAFNAGGDINSEANLSQPVTLSIGRDLGSFYTGRSLVVGGGVQGDAGLVFIETGGRVGVVSIGGNIAADGDGSPAPNVLTRFVNQVFVIRTGLDQDQRGDIGFITVSGHVTGDTLTVDTSASPGSIVGGLVVSDGFPDFGDRTGDDVGFFDGLEGVNLILGEGSDIRFVDTPNIDLQEGQSTTLPIITGQTLELVDDAGGRIEISVSQVTAFPQQVGEVIVVPVEGAQGVAIARIEVDLVGTGTIAGGVTLTIRGSAGQDINDIISIGRILVRTSNLGAGIIIDGPAQIDVRQIDAPQGLATIENRTPGGDIVAIDTLTLNTLRILDGDLGRTQVPVFGPRLIGPDLGLQSGVNGAVEGALGINPIGTDLPILDLDFNGQIFRPTTDGVILPLNAYLDDIGSPIDPFLNGLVVRTGVLTLVEVDGALGDVITQDPTSDILTIRVNADNTTPNGEFDGIVGTIFAAGSIDLVQIGDGLSAGENGSDTPFAETGIFAQRSIRRIEGTRPGAFISGRITAAGSTIAPNAAMGSVQNLGIDSISLTGGGDIRDAFIGTTDLDQFWNSFFYGNDNRVRGDIRELRTTNGDLFRSIVTTNDITDLVLTNGFFDATDLSITGEVITSIQAAGFRNTTLGGDALEFRVSRISIGEDLETLTVTNNGDISDTIISVVGDIDNRISARDIVRSSIEVANTIRNLALTGSLLASTITTGQILALTVNDSVRVSTIEASGPIISFRVLNEIDRSRISVTGPDGRIDRLSVTNDIDADISSSGRIGTIESTAGSIFGSITTTTDRADIAMISADLDIAATTDIGGNLAMIEAGRNIGDAANPSVILVRGNLTELDVANGRLFSDLRVGGSVTREIMIGATANTPLSPKGGDGDITVFGRIAEVTVEGDFDGVITSESGGIGLITINNGSLLAGGGVIARDAGIGTVAIIRGHLFGTIFGELGLGTVLVDGQGSIFGDIGINPNLSSGASTADANRNQLPPGVVATTGIDGPIIASGRGIGSIIVTSGDIYEAFIYARTFIGLIDVRAGGIFPNDASGTRDATVIAAGDLIQEVRVSGQVSNTLFLAGAVSFGDESIFNIGDPQYDDRAGVVSGAATGADTNGAAGDAADTIKAGRIETVTIGGNALNVSFAAGVTAGNDGRYNTFDAGEGHVVGFSFIDRVNIAGTRTNVTFNADRGAVFLNGVNVRGSNFGATAPNADGLLAPLNDAFANGPIDLSLLGTEVPRNGSAVFTWNGTTFRVNWNAPAAAGPAQAAGQGVIWDGNGTLILANTAITHEVIVTVLDNDGNPSTALPGLVDFNIRSNDEASVGLLRVTGENGRARLLGNSNIVVDNFVRSLEIGDYEGTGRIIVGADVGTFSANRFAGGGFSANFVRTVNVTASLVALNGTSPFFSFGGLGTLSVAQNATATVNVERSADTVDINGTAAQFLFRAGGSLGSFEANRVDRSRLSVADTIGSIDVAGDVFDTSFIAGGDLGSDVTDGNGSSSGAIDRATSGTIGDVEIGGNFRESDIIAGFLRGADRFFGTADDAGAAGSSTIGQVEIGGTQTGSGIGSESYAILSAGTIEEVEIGGQDGESSGNFTVGNVVGRPVPIRVTNFQVLQDARVYTAFFTFDQAIDIASFVQALQIREVRDEASAQMPFDPSDPLSLEAPTPGVSGSGDYTVVYDEESFIVSVTIDRAVTDRDLVFNSTTMQFERSPEASPGIYRFELLTDVLRALNAQARLDGDGDGFPELGDDFSIDDVVGDAGDAAGPRSAETVTLMGQNGALVDIDFYDAVDLDLLLDSNLTPDGLPETNSVRTIRGAIGDHPDRDLNLFGFGGDRDVYQITLQAGQILRLGPSSGPAAQLVRTLYFLPSGGGAPEAESITTGVANLGAETANTILLPVDVPDLSVGETTTETALLIKETGTYVLVVEPGAGLGVSQFLPGAVPNDDPEANQVGNYAFTIEVFDDGDSGFNAGSDAGNGTNIVNAPGLSVFSTTNPAQRVTIGDFVFQRLAGADGVFGNTDDVVSGLNSDGSIVSTLTGNRSVSTISSSLGRAGVPGQPGVIFSDVDVFHLNNFQPITAGTFVTITVKLADSGTDLGSFQTENALTAATFTALQDLGQVVQFGLFETTGSTNAQAADLIFSPSDFTSTAGTPNTVIARNGGNSYGFDANGDFFISFAVPPSLSGGNGSFAVYLQGAFQGDYQIEVVTQGTAQQQVRSQNVLIEIDGGTIDWLSIDGSPVSFGGFDIGTLGFSGLVGSQSVQSFLLEGIVDRLNQIFESVGGFDVNFSINPADFEFEDFSTVFLTSDNNPFGLLTASDYGVSERSDPFNSDSRDEAVVFAPAYSTLGFQPTTADLNNLIDSLSAGIGRRVGELVGLRLTQQNDVAEAGGDIDLFNEESIAFPFLDGPASNLLIPGVSRELVNHREGFLGVDNTGFFLGDQNASALLDRILAPAAP